MQRMQGISRVGAGWFSGPVAGWSSGRVGKWPRGRAIRQAAARTVTAVSVVALAALAVAPTPAVAQPDEAGSAADKTRKQILRKAKDQAVKRIAVAARSDQPELRMNAIEAMQPLPNRARPLAELGLNDDNKAVRFAALVTVGKLELKSLGEAAKARIDAEEPSIRAAALYAAHQCGYQVDLSPLARLAASPDPTVRGNAVLVLGLMGEPSAKAMLESVGKAPMPKADGAREAVVRIQIGEALVRLGDDSALEPLRAAVYSRHLEARVLAVTVLGKLGDRKIIGALQPLLEQPPIELQLAAAKALARLSQQGEMPGTIAVAQDVLLKGAGMNQKQVRQRAERFLNQSNRQQVDARFKRLLKDKALRRSVAANLRTQAAFGLAHLPRKKAARRLVKLMKNDRSPRVKLAAAAAIVEALAGDSPRKAAAR